jgi:hypothetical protein
MLLMPRLALLTPVRDAELPAMPGTAVDPVELLQRVFNEPAGEAQRRLDAVRRRRDFRLVQGTKTSSGHEANPFNAVPPCRIQEAPHATLPQFGRGRRPGEVSTRGASR